MRYLTISLIYKTVFIWRKCHDNLKTSSSRCLSLLRAVSDFRYIYLPIITEHHQRTSRYSVNRSACYSQAQWCAGVPKVIFEGHESYQLPTVSDAVSCYYIFILVSISPSRLHQSWDKDEVFHFVIMQFFGDLLACVSVFRTSIRG